MTFPILRAVRTGSTDRPHKQETQVTDPEFTSKQMAEQFRDVAEEFWDFTQDKWNEVDHAVLLESALLGNLHANLAVVERLDTLIRLLTPQDIRITQTSGPAETRCESCGRTGNHRCKGPLNE